MRTLDRHAAIQDIRAAVLKLVDDEHSVCELCTRLNIMCRGFRQLSDEELRRRYKWLVERRDPKTREELEVLANRWQLARQLATGKELACDVQLEERDTCDGWDTFSTTELARFYKQMIGEEVQ